MLFALLLLFSAATAPEAPLVLTGLDPVRLVEGAEVDGRDELAREHEGFTYLFESEATRARFDAEPARYAVQNGGICARMGGTTAGSPDLFAVHDGRLYLFGSPECRTAFVAEPRAYLEHDPERAPWTPAARRAGDEWAARALAATGGAAAWRALERWQEQAATGTRSVQRRFDFAAGHLRLDRRFDRFLIAEIVTPEGAVADAGRGRRPLRAAQVRALRREHALHPAALLRALARDGARLAPVLRGEEGGLHLLELDLDGRVVTLLLGADGVPQAVRVTGRGDGGRVGLVTERWEDWRAVGAVRAPFRRLPAGVPPERALAFEAIVANPEPDPAVFVLRP
jgi:YHS domain-containing protein